MLDIVYIEWYKTNKSNPLPMYGNQRNSPITISAVADVMISGPAFYGYVLFTRRMLLVDAGGVHRSSPENHRKQQVQGGIQREGNFPCCAPRSTFEHDLSSSRVLQEVF